MRIWAVVTRAVLGVCVLVCGMAGVAWAEERPGRKGDRSVLVCEEEGDLLVCEREEQAKAKPPVPSAGEVDNAYNKGFQDAVREMKRMFGEYRDAQAYVWERPMVQKVWMPPQIVNGVFIPGHQEYVLLHPSEWNLKKPEPGETKEGRKGE